jgi:hypothetical protein
MTELKSVLPAGHITSPGKMTLLEIGGDINFYTSKVNRLDTLKLGEVYELCIGAFDSLYLRPFGNLDMPSKIYDFDKDFRTQVLTSFRSLESDMSIGVLLEGYKGQGKTLMAKQLCIESGLPIVIISCAIPANIDFTGFLNQIKQDYVLFIDEFEKLFPEFDNKEERKHTQNSFLSFLSGATSLQNKRLVIFTSNEPLNDKFNNRPGRVRYYKQFNFMPQEIFDAILKDKLIYKEFEQDLLDNIEPGSCTVDILTTILQEINIQKKPYSEFKSFFNYKEKTYIYSKYKKNTLGLWEFIDDISSKKEISIDPNSFSNIIPYNSVVIKNDVDGLMYKIKEHTLSPEGIARKQAQNLALQEGKSVNDYEEFRELFNKTNLDEDGDYTNDYHYVDVIYRLVKTPTIAGSKAF